MVSRRKILSRSRDDLNMEAPPQEEEEDIWYQKEKLYKVTWYSWLAPPYKEYLNYKKEIFSV